MQIPIIDFHPFIVGDTVAKDSVASQISTAVRDLGCFYLKNSGVPKTLITQVFAQAKWFFALPQEEKSQVALFEDGTCRGYAVNWNEVMLNESFGLSKEIFIDEFDVGSYCLDAPNKWLKYQINFREIFWQYLIACYELSWRILQAFALALKLKETYFTDFHLKQNYNALLHHYPALLQPPKSGKFRFFGHTDLGSISLLLQDEAAGLEVCTPAGNWLAVPSIPNTILVMTGDLIQRWTNDKFRATKHRVPIPSEFSSTNERYSIVYFMSPDYDTNITCIESCLDANESPKYPPILTREYFKTMPRIN